MRISGVILTKNAETSIETCVNSLNFCSEVVIIDDYSADSTLEKIKNNHKVQIFKRKLNSDFAGQRNFAMEKAKNDWLLFIDADEKVNESLKKEIISAIASQSANSNRAFFIKRRDYFLGKEMKYGETSKARSTGLIRLIKKGAGKWEGRVHETFKLKEQRVKNKTLRNYLDHYPHQTIREFIEEVNFYSTIRAGELFEQIKRASILEIIFFPLGKFVYTYFFLAGFLDGAQGFIYSFFMSFHSFLVRAKLYQYANINLKSKIKQ